MNRKADNERLLDEIFGDGAENIRQATIVQALRLVHRRRQRRQIHGLVLLGALVVLLASVWYHAQRPAGPLPMAATPILQRGFALVHSQPLPAAALIQTRAVLSQGFVVSQAEVEVVQTKANNYQDIDDEQLLALLVPRPAALVRLGPHSEELVFANPDDANSVLGN